MADEPELRSFNLRRKTKADTGDVGVPFDVGDEDHGPYHLHPRAVNGLVLADVVSQGVWVAEGSTPMWRFLEQGLGPDEFPEFKAFMLGPDIDIEAEDFGELIMWMLEQCGEVPTTPSPSSRAGRRSTTRTSTARSPAKAST